MVSLAESWDTGAAVSELAVSPNGARVAVVQSKTVTLWDIATGENIGTLGLSYGWICSIAFSPDGRKILFGTYYCEIHIWDSEIGGSELLKLGGHSEMVFSAIYSPDERFIVSGSYDRTIRFWDPRTGDPLGKPISTNSYVYCVDVSSDCTRVVGACADKTIKVYDVTTRTAIFQGVGHTKQVSSVAFSPDGRRIVSGSHDFTVRIWDAETGQDVGDPLIGHTGLIGSVVFSPDGKYIASASHDHTIRVWDAWTGAMLNDPLRSHTEAIYGIAFTPDSACLVSGSSDQTIKIWDLRSITWPANSLEGHVPLESRPLEDAITSTTTLEQIVVLLGARGCVDMTAQLQSSTHNDLPISSGGFGDIYKGTLKTGVEVAIKTIKLYIGSDEHNQGHLKNAAREIYTWSTCRHRNVQRLLGLAVFRGQIGMIALWEANGNLPKYLQHNQDADRCVLSTQIAEGLSYLHNSGMVHGDLKGANVLVSHNGVAQLADFGNSKLREYTLQFSDTSSKQSISPRWAAPELFRGTKCNTHTDVYALGMTILEVFTGDVPWAGKSDQTIMFAVVIEKVCPERPETYIPTYSEHGDILWSLLKSCWESEPEKRPTAVTVEITMKSVTKSGLNSRDVEMDVS